MNNQYLIPANSKKGQLIFNIFRPVDLGIFITGVTVTFILLVIFANINAATWLSILAIVPAGVAVILVFPIRNYHNVRVVLGEIINFYSNNRNYKWRGWCAKYEYERKQ